MLRKLSGKKPSATHEKIGRGPFAHRGGPQRDSELACQRGTPIDIAGLPPPHFAIAKSSTPLGITTSFSVAKSRCGGKIGHALTDTNKPVRAGGCLLAPLLVRHQRGSATRMPVTRCGTPAALGRLAMRRRWHGYRNVCTYFPLVALASSFVSRAHCHEIIPKSCWKPRKWVRNLLPCSTGTDNCPFAFWRVEGQANRQPAKTAVRSTRVAIASPGTAVLPVPVR